MKINQYCSVCKKHLDMEVIPTDDGGDDGVIWLRCPECQGFLPKFTGEGLASSEGAKPQPPADESAAPSTASATPSTDSPASATPDISEPLIDDLDSGDDDDAPASFSDAKRGKTEKNAEPETPPEPIAEYAALLAAADPESARPYRPSSAYGVGDVIHHLAYDDVGIVVAKESLPGGRQAVKVFFEDTGVVHLIEQAADGN